MKKITNYWRYLALFIMLFGGLSATYAQTPSNVVATELDATSVEITWDVTGGSALWDVNRIEVLNEAGTTNSTLIDQTTDQIVTDSDWGIIDPGVYQWEVINGASDVSNTLDVDMTTDVNVTVTTEYGDDPTATVTFTNTSEPALSLEYTQTLSATGEYTFEDFRKGTYDITVTLDGYADITLTGEDIWADPDYMWNMDGIADPPGEVWASSTEIYYGTDVELNWTTGASSEFHGYNVYRDGVKLNITPLDVTTYTDDADLTCGTYEYSVTAVYIDNGESAETFNNDDVVVIETGDISGNVEDALTTAAISGATVTIDGLDEFGNTQSYEVTTDVSGDYTEEVWPGTYDVSVSADGYVDGLREDEVVVCNVTTTGIDFSLAEYPYAVSSVVAEVEGDSIKITWVPNPDRSFDQYEIYREANLQEVSPFEADALVGTTTGTIFYDNEWDDVGFKAGVYSWYVVASYDANSSVAVYSNTLDKDMLTEVNVEVTTEFGDDPTATVTFTNTSEPALDIEYTHTLDASGLYTFTDFRKGTYDIEVTLEGYQTANETDESIWGEEDYSWELLGDAPPPQNLVAVNDSLYMGVDDVKLSWEAPASSEFAGYIVYRDGVALFDIPISDLNYTDVDPPYNMDFNGWVYTVKAFYLSGATSGPSNSESVWVTGMGSVDGVVYDAREDVVIEGALVRMDGEDEFGFPQTYEFTTDEDGLYSDTTVWAGDYDYEAVMTDYNTSEATRTVNYDATTTQDFYLFPAMEVTATENADQDEVLVEWQFTADASRELIDFTIYRGMYDDIDMEYDYTLLGSTVSTNFIDTDWGVVESGVYKWKVEANYDDGTTENFSNTLDKDMEVAVELTVGLNSAESPEGANVFLNNISEPLLELSYDIDMDATGTTTVDPVRKGLYDIKVSLFGYETQIFSDVRIESDTAFSYVLQELITAVQNLYVNPNGYATWNMPTPGGLDEYFTDFTGEIPSDITVQANGSGGAPWAYSSFYGGVARSGYSSSSGYTDTRMNTPKVALDANTVVQFDWYVYSYGDTELTIDISLDEGLTWNTIFTASTSGESAGSWYSTTIDVAGLGYDAGDAMFSAHKTDEWGWWVYLDNWYIGPATTTAGTIAISENIGDQNLSRENGEAVIADLEIFEHNSLALNRESNRSLETFKVSLDGVFSGNTTNEFYDYEEVETLVEGTEYVAKVEALYTTGTSDPMYYTFTYHACDYYNPAEDFTATRVEGAMDIALAWTNDDSDVDTDEFVGTNVYRDGELLAFVEAGTETYLDEDVASGDYTYCVTQLYFSEAESCEACDDVTMTPGGYVNGFVTAFDGGAAIEGATIAIVGSTDSFIFTTDSTGYYEGEVVEGTYEYTVSAEGYETQTLEDVVIDFGATVTNDFAMLEYPYAVGEVIATELNDDAVLVNWSGNATAGTSEWLIYDTDAVVFDGIGAEDADYSLIWGSKWEPAQLSEYGTGYVTKVSVYQSQPQVDYLSEVRIMSGDGTTVLYSQDVTGELVTGQWNIIELDEAVEFDNTENLWIGMYVERPGGTTNEPTADALTVISDRYDYFAYNGAAWTSISGEYGITDQAWMLRGFVSTTPSGRAVALGQGDYNTTPRKDYSTVESVPSGKGMIEATGESSKFPQYANQSTRALTGYNVYRGLCGSAAEDMTFMGYTLDQQFTDNTWGTADAGVYTWAVEAVYDYNESAFTYSNCLDKDMVTTVSVDVSTNSGDSPIDTDVAFTNTSEPDLELMYETTLDDTGMFTWDEFRKGTYDILVHKNGFNDIILEGVDIWEPTEFTWVLEELLAPPVDLYVTPLGYATWGAGGVVPFEPVYESFDEGLPETWTVVDGGSTTDTWYMETPGGNPQSSGSSIDGTPFMFCDSDGAGSGSTMDELLISPVIEYTENADMLYVEFDYLYINLSTDWFAVDVFDGNDWVEVFYSNEDSGSFPWDDATHAMIDVTEYANADFQVRFHYVAPGWDWYVAVDNFAVTDGSDRYADRELQYYKVWLDGNFIADTDTTFYQYDESTLVEGQQYFSEVAAVYSTGISAKMNYTWTYHSCETFAGPEQFLAANVEGTYDVLIQWSDILPLQLVNITQNPGSPANGYFQQYDYGYGVVFDLSSYPDALANSIEFHHASWGVSGPHDYNIHIIDWDTEEVLAELGPFTTTGDDQWEMGVELGDVDLNGASNVAFLMEPLSNSSTDAYPDLSSDDAADPQGSVFGPLDDIGSIGASGIGNFLMNINIMTANGPVRVTSTQLDIAATPEATPRVGSGHTVTESVITNQVASRDREDAFVGANLYRDDVLIAEMVMDTFYVDQDLVPAYYDYCIMYMYESGAHSCAMCIEDVMVPEDCDAPQNLTATLNEETYESIDLAWNQAIEVEYRYDDGISTGQLGSSTGTTNTLLGNVHRVDAELSEMSWYLTAEGGPHNNINIWVIGLDGSGIPDGNNVLFTSSVTNTDEQWNTFTFNEPLVVEGGFFLGVSFNGFAAIGTDDGTGSPYEFVPNTHYFVGDYTAGGWETWETYDFNVNGMIRATGMEASVASYAVEPIESEGTSDFTLVRSPEATVTGSPDWTNAIASDQRAFTGYNIYRDGSLLVEGHQENTYTDSEGLENGGLYCYEVTSVYSVCGESAASNEACAGFVGIDEFDDSSVALYPNPATSLVNVSSTVEMNRITVTNYVGQVVYEAELNDVTSVKLNTGSYENGVYIIRLNSENGVVTKRVIIAQ